MAYRFRRNCERSDGILQRCLNPTEDTLNDEYIEQSDEGGDIISPEQRVSKDSRVLVASDCGLYEYRPPVGLNVKLVKNDVSPQPVRLMSAAKKVRVGNTTTTTTSSSSSSGSTATPLQHTIYLKSEPLNEDDSLDENDCIDVLYDVDSNFDDSYDPDRTVDTPRKFVTKSRVDDMTSEKLMQPNRPVRTNKIRLGYTSTNKGKNNMPATGVMAKNAATTTALSMATAAGINKGKLKENGSKENSTTNRSPKSKTNAKGEPKQPKKCEICGNTYTYQHALERYDDNHNGFSFLFQKFY